MLSRMAPSGLILGSPKWAAQFDASIKGLNDGSVKIGIGTIEAFGTGIDLPTVAVGVLSMPITSKQLFNQVCGRLCRSNQGQKAGARLYVLVDRKIYGLAMVSMLAKWSRFVLVQVGDKWVPSKEFLLAKKRPRS